MSSVTWVTLFQMLHQSQTLKINASVVRMSVCLSGVWLSFEVKYSSRFEFIRSLIYKRDIWHIIWWIQRDLSDIWNSFVQESTFPLEKDSINTEFILNLSSNLPIFHEPHNNVSISRFLFLRSEENSWFLTMFRIFLVESI